MSAIDPRSGMFSFEGSGDASGGLGEASSVPTTLDNPQITLFLDNGELNTGYAIPNFGTRADELPLSPPEAPSHVNAIPVFDADGNFLRWDDTTPFPIYDGPDDIWLNNGTDELPKTLPSLRPYPTAVPAFDENGVFLYWEDSRLIPVEPYTLEESTFAFEESSLSNGEVGGGYVVQITPSNTEGLVLGGDIVRLTEMFQTPSFNSVRGDGQTIVVIDTRFDSDHQLLGPDTNGDGRSDRVLLTWDFADGDANVNNPAGVTSHGTFVASVAAGAMQGSTLASSFHPAQLQAATGDWA
jgi:subtilisin family serine protease